MEVKTQADKAERFVTYVLRRGMEDTGFSARLRRADNPDTEYQSYEMLVKFGINIEHDFERLPYALVGASLARLKPSKDGTASLGKALKSCFTDGDQGDVRLRRLLACNQLDELCRILRPLLVLIGSKNTQALCYSRLLKDLQYFNKNAQDIKRRWAQDYYSYASLPNVSTDVSTGTSTGAATAEES